MVAHSAETVRDQVNAALLIVRSVIDGESLNQAGMQKASAFHKQVYQKCEMFMVHDNGDTCLVDGRKVMYLYGADAMKARLMSLSSDIEKGAVDLTSLKVFRQFRWLLTPQEDLVVKRCVTEERRKRQNILEKGMIMDAPLGKHEDCVKGAAAPTQTAGAAVEPENTRRPPLRRAPPRRQRWLRLRAVPTPAPAPRRRRPLARRHLPRASSRRLRRLKWVLMVKHRRPLSKRSWRFSCQRARRAPRRRHFSGPSHGDQAARP
ncbi:unnamed protein product [Prorocentrum cordatum]|uniref:Uncharacterized protein n=1 Tax=Prorocentrum cordatum TaxID=2364126 RepID=A0ABN9VPP8_9DINO|nr:unnamed protein product [Polarella glacialis]